MSPKTITTYADSAEQLVAHVLAHSDVRDACKICGAHVEDFLAELAAARRPATVSVRFRAQQFFGWLVDEEELPRSPVERMRRPIVPEEPVEVVDLGSRAG